MTLTDHCCFSSLPHLGHMSHIRFCRWAQEKMRSRVHNLHVFCTGSPDLLLGQSPKSLVVMTSQERGHSNVPHQNGHDTKSAVRRPPSLWPHISGGGAASFLFECEKWIWLNKAGQGWGECRARAHMECKRVRSDTVRISPLPEIWEPPVTPKVGLKRVWSAHSSS